MDYHALTKKCDGMCDSCECPPARSEFVTCGGGLPGDPNGEQAALAVEVLVRKYEGAMLRGLDIARKRDAMKTHNDKGKRTPEARSAVGGPLDPPVVPL